MGGLQSGLGYQKHRIAYILGASVALCILGSVLPDFGYILLYLNGSNLQAPELRKFLHAEWAIAGIILMVIGTGYFVSYFCRLCWNGFLRRKYEKKY